MNEDARSYRKNIILIHKPMSALKVKIIQWYVKGGRSDYVFNGFGVIFMIVIISHLQAQCYHYVIWYVDH